LTSNNGLLEVHVPENCDYNYNSTLTKSIGNVLQLIPMNRVNTVQSLIKGAENLNMYNLISVGTRRVMNLPLLKIIGHQIENLIGQHIVN
jgi:hypothetical protein